MPVEVFKDAKLKVEAICDKADLKPKGRANGELTGAFIDWAYKQVEHHQDVGSKKYFERQVRDAVSQNQIMDTQARLIAAAIGLQGDYKTCLLDCENSDFHHWLATHALPQPITAQTQGHLELVNKKRCHHLRRDLVHVDLISAEQGGDLSPILIVRLGIIQLGADLAFFAYGFLQLIVSFEFGDESPIELRTPPGTPLITPAEKPANFQLRTDGSPGEPSFVLEAQDHAFALEGRGEFASLGRLIRLKPGNQIKVTVKAKIDRDMLAPAASVPNDLKMREEIINAAVKGKFIQRAGEADLGLTPDQEYILLASQIVTVQSC
ncbi:MAG: hypothetical protein AAF607_04630 [Pseudomonadota bacterium]